MPHLFMLGSCHSVLMSLQHGNLSATNPMDACIVLVSGWSMHVVTGIARRISVTSSDVENDGKSSLPK